MQGETGGRLQPEADAKVKMMVCMHACVRACARRLHGMYSYGLYSYGLHCYGLI